ncbi:MAG: PBP1A family penicillin-binding protein [Peptococcaceae bacterium]|nr:PBP1A family penicillin-binding protein [Peptococcaceae bacterium]
MMDRPKYPIDPQTRDQQIHTANIENQPTNQFDFSGATLSHPTHKIRNTNPPSKRSGKTRTPSTKKALLIKKILLITAIVFLVGCIGFGTFVWASTRDMPPWKPELIDNMSYASIVYDSEGNQIAQLSSVENRLPFAYEDLPETLKESIIAVEDHRFYKHMGFDPLRIAKGVINTMINPDKPEGGSTITTQLAKNTFIDVEDRTAGGNRAVKRKIQELVLAMRIERNYSKDDILFAYLSQIYLGHGAYGVRSAAQVYFGKELDELTPPEIALICGMPQAPHTYDPYTNPESAIDRRATVLYIMLQQGIITEEDYETYKEEPFTFIEQVQSGEKIIKMGSSSYEKHYPYFVDYVVSCLLDPNKYNLSDKQVYQGGLQIYTTVDPKIQVEAERVMRDPANFPADAKDGAQVQGAAVLLENATGNVVAMVGGREYPEDHQRCFNRASEASRQPGSCAKPVIVYAPALDKGGYFTGTVFDDCPTTFPDNYKPNNASGGYLGLLTMREAIRHSINIYAIKLYQDAGPEYCFAFAENLGLTLKPSDPSYLSNALGTFEVSPLEMARAYSAFPNKGMLNEVHCVTKILSSDNRTILETQPSAIRAMKTATAYIMCDMMQDVVEQGTGRNAIISNWYVGGKTGTTDAPYGGSPDIWFTGFTPLYTGAVWMGFDTPDKDHTLPSGTYGGDRPARLWQMIMVKALVGKSRQTTIGPTPDDVIKIQYDAFSGLQPSQLTPQELIRTDLCAIDSLPPNESDIWVPATPGTPGRRGDRVYLNMDSTFWSVIDRSPDKELKYQPPWEATNNKGGPRTDDTIPTYIASLRGNTVTFVATPSVRSNSIYVSARITIRNPNNNQYERINTTTNLNRFTTTIPSSRRSDNTHEFRIEFTNIYGSTVTSQTITVR